MTLNPTLACLMVTFSSYLPGAETYWFGNPAPTSAMRELSTDRPDTTESPYTVDAGHFQIEAEPLSWTRNKQDGVTTTSMNPSVNIKVGLLTWVDLQAVVGWSRVTEEDPGNDDRVTRGVDDLTFRVKMNFWGNDGGDTAGALMPFVTLPTHDSDFGDQRYVTGGLIAPVAFTLPSGWSAAVMLELDLERNLADDGYTTILVQTVTASHAIIDEVDGFIELVNNAPTESGAEATAYADAGITWGVTPNLQFDTGTNIGLTRASDDVRFFFGVSYRH